MDLSKNRIAQMVDLSHLVRLTRLVMSENQLKSFAGFTGHNNIVYLEIKKN